MGGFSLATHWRAAVIAAAALAAIGAVLSIPAIPQDLAYHSFADQRTFFGIPNGLNVLSNVAFLVVGLLGISVLLADRDESGRTPWLVFFVGVALVSVGSAYYHWSPDSNSLLWDRLPMTVGFMGLLVALAQDYFQQPVARSCLIPAILIGMASVVYWHLTDDLRFYLLVQFLPLVFLLLVMLLYTSPFTHGYLLGAALTLYVLAKIVEVYDTDILELTANVASGHTVKHLFAAAGCLCLVIYLRSRTHKNKL